MSFYKKEDPHRQNARCKVYVQGVKTRGSGKQKSEKLRGAVILAQKVK